MKNFFINLLIFLTPVVLFFLGAELYVRNFNTVMGQKQSYLSKHADKIEVLILGTSHMANGIDPNLLDLHALNAANGSQSLYYDIEITKQYLPEMTSLKYVMMGMDYHSLYFTYKPEREFMYSYYYDIDYKDHSNMKSDLSLFYYGYGFKEGLRLFSSSPVQIKKGFSGIYITNFDQMTLKEGKNRVKDFNKIIDENQDHKKEIIANLNSFIELLKSKNITPILVSMPCHENFNRHLDPKIVSENYKSIEKISKNYNVKHLDYLFDEVEDSLYYNVNHLNQRGAEIFTSKINQEILEMEKKLINKLN